MLVLDRGSPVDWASGSIRMITALDVAQYILEKHGPMSAMKLQKLVYYSQAWSLVWDEAPMFTERIEAWRNGPVVRELYDAHKGQYMVKCLKFGNPSELSQDARDTIDAVLNGYGDLNADQLSALTHEEEPWKQARQGYEPEDPCGREITHDVMAEYYSSIQTNG